MLKTVAILTRLIATRAINQSGSIYQHQSRVIENINIWRVRQYFLDPMQSRSKSTLNSRFHLPREENGGWVNVNNGIEDTDASQCRRGSRLGSRQCSLLSPPSSFSIIATNSSNIIINTFSSTWIPLPDYKCRELLVLLRTWLPNSSSTPPSKNKKTIKEETTPPLLPYSLITPGRKVEEERRNLNLANLKKATPK